MTEVRARVRTGNSQQDQATQPRWWIWSQRSALGLVLAAVTALALHKILGYDIWGQIGAGEWIAHNGFPRVDPFSYAYPGRLWIEPRWLWCLLAYRVFESLGPNALILLKAALLLAAFGLLVTAGDSRRRWTAAVGAAMALAAAQDRFWVRPELLTFVGLAATLWILERYRRGGRRAWLILLPLMQCVWSNAHTLWILGPAVQWILLAGETFQVRVTRWVPRLRSGAALLAPDQRRLLAAVATISSLAALINPYLLEGLAFPFRLFRELGSEHFLGGAIFEFHSPFSDLLFRADPRTVGFLAVVVLSLMSFVANRDRFSLGRAALWTAFLVLAVRAHRNVSLFGFVAGYATMLNLAERFRTRGPARTAVAWTAAAALYAATLVPLAVTDSLYRWQDVSREFGLGVSDRRYPDRALAFLREHALPTPLIHSLGDGGYVLFEGGPASVFVDGRLEVYGDANLREALELTKRGAGLSAVVERTAAATALVRNDPKDQGLFRALEAAPDWVAVYYDPRHVLYLRVTPRTRMLAAELAVDWQDPPVFDLPRPGRMGARDPIGVWFPKAPDNFADERLGTLFAAVGNYGLAERHFAAAVEQVPGDPRASLMLGLIYRGTGRREAAGALLRALPRRFREDPDGHLLAGRILMSRRESAEALKEFESAVERGGFVAQYAEPLARAAIAAGRYEQAGRVLDRLVSAEPLEPDYHNLRGVLSLKLQRPEEARRHFTRSLELRPDQPQIRGMMPPPAGAAEGPARDRRPDQ